MGHIHVVENLQQHTLTQFQVEYLGGRWEDVKRGRWEDVSADVVSELGQQSNQYGL